MLNKFICLFFLLMGTVCLAQPPQIAIPRINQMPDQPSPYNLRDWKQVAIEYDSFVYNTAKSGQYLPLSYILPQGFNYKQRAFFGLHTYVGTNSPMNNEAINVLPSLVGASLCGVDKSNQYAQNWVLMSQDFFNKNNGELLYLNNNNTATGNDWWYDLMPNVFFYQLFDLYPSIGGEADIQFIAIADRFLESVRALGGKDTPWQKANMNYRAFNFKTMLPNAEGVKEPEAAGAYAWVLYNAYTKTHNPEYLKAAEWSLEFLNSLNTNPSYELQLPYGTYTAARMNAELGTNYNIQKMLTWSFDRGSLRGWGTIVGKWGGFDVSGLVGEANDNGDDYAFQLNGVQQAAMLVPLVRYDKRFANAIGKWMVNLANATRLFYPGFLPDNLQDASAWSATNDPQRVIGYEALKEKWMGNSPFSTGDALKGGWGKTNLALYGTSSIGYMGSLIHPTNVEKILRLDLLKTDFYHTSAYPTSLLYNPYSVSKNIEMELGGGLYDIYDAVSETFLIQNATGTISVSIPALTSIIATIVPASGVVTYDKNKMLINDVIVDYKQSKNLFTYTPRIQSLAASDYIIEKGKSTQIFAKVFDQDSNIFNWEWNVSGGIITGSGSEVHWKAPESEGIYHITTIVKDEIGNSDTATIDIEVVAEINLPPSIDLITDKSSLIPDGIANISANAIDPNGDPITYSWSATGGTIDGTQSNITWKAPLTEGVYDITLKASDDKGLSTSQTISILVYNFPNTYNSNLVAWYPFSGTGRDSTLNHLDALVSGVRYVPDFNSNPKSACLFDGINDFASVNSDPKLNFQNGITLSCWIQAGDLPSRESFVISHGSWQNRYKLSITPERRLRWTVNTEISIADLDAKSPLEVGNNYLITATYDGKIMCLYINGELESYKQLTGKIRTTDLPFLIGQMLPDESNYNFSGIIDEVKIYDQAHTPEEVKAIYNNDYLDTKVSGINTEIVIYPNPVRDQLYIQFTNEVDSGLLTIYDLMGVVVKTKPLKQVSQLKVSMFDLPPGVYTIMVTTGKTKNKFQIVKI